MTKRKLTERIRRDLAAAAATAKRILESKPILIDVNATGFNDLAEICEIAIIDHNGNPFLHTLVKPIYGIPFDGSRGHGIRGEDVAGAPTLDEALDDDLLDMIAHAPGIAMFNANFHLRMFRQSAATIERYDIVNLFKKIYPRVGCLMALYAEWYGEWSAYECSYATQSLTAAAKHCGLEWDCEEHSALAGAKMALSVLRRMAEQAELDDGR